MTGDDVGRPLRHVIRSSWLRSQAANASREHLDPSYRPDHGMGQYLRVAAEPVLQSFNQHLGSTNVGVVLADREARIVGRWGDADTLRQMGQLSIEEGFTFGEDDVGTNAIGTPIEILAPVAICGDEHYNRTLRLFYCVGVPIRHPVSRRLEGVLNLSCEASAMNSLLLPTTLNLAAQIERELTARTSMRQLAVFEQFLERTRRTSAPLIAMGEQFTLTNSPAESLLSSSDQSLLRAQAAESYGSAQPVRRRFRLAEGDEIEARCWPVLLGRDPIGTLLEVHSTARADRLPSRQARVRRAFAFHSAAWQEIEERIDRADIVNAKRVRLVGESGVGKLALARRLHELRVGDGAAKLTVLDGAAAGRTQSIAPHFVRHLNRRLSEGGGTVVVRHVEVLRPPDAATVADLLDSAPSDVHVITTVTVAADSEFVGVDRRFGDCVLRLPPLRNRRDDLPDLLELLGDGGQPKLAPRAMAILMSHDWPGNIAELHDVLSEARVASAGAAIDVAHLPPYLQSVRPGRGRFTKLEEMERAAIQAALREHGANKSRVAEALGMSRSTLYRRLRQLGLDNLSNLP